MRAYKAMIGLLFGCALSCAPCGWAQASSAKTTKTTKPAKLVKPEKLVPLTPQERAEQLLDRFTFGPRPGDVDRVLAMGADKWFELQMNPDSIKDPAWARRQGEFPTLTMTPEQVLVIYPNRDIIQQISDGKKPMPTDPLLAAAYEVQVAKLKREAERRKPDANGNLPPEPTDAQKTEQKNKDTLTANTVAGELFAMPKKDRMEALCKMSVDERIAFTTYLAGDQRNVLFNDFTPHEREIFNAMQANIGSPYRIGEELAQAKMVRAILTERQLQEVMTDFWFNHFNIYLQKDSDQWYTTSYERDAIRKNALGKFADLLLATAQHPAMLVYLDNWTSIGPGSLANGVNPANPKSKPGNRGLNENYGREVMELHTVGVNGGYSQTDVTNLSAVLTGWTVNNPNAGGGFQFDPKRHEPGTKTWLGYSIGTGAPFVIQGAQPAVVLASAKVESATSGMMGGMMSMDDMMAGGSPSGANHNAVAMAGAPGNEGMKEGLEALNLLARSPQTAHFISWKIAQRFVADDPPPALVDRMAKTFVDTGGGIKAVLRTLIASPEFNSRRYFRTKVKTPMEFLTSAYRATATEPTNPGALVNAMRTMGMPLYAALPPTGYYITADRWMNSTALVARLNFADQLTSGRFSGHKFDAARIVGLGMLEESAAPVKQVASKDAVRPALGSLERQIIGGDVSKKTEASMQEQIGKATDTAPPDLLNLMAGLLIGSPEFQVR